jgi:hypothetical protein
LIERLAASDRASFTRHDLLRAALDVVAIGDRPADDLRSQADRLVGRLLDSELVLALHAEDPLQVGDSFRRADGTSVFTRHARERWTLTSTLDREAWLLQVAPEPAGTTVDSDTIEQAVRRHRLGVDQAAAVNQLLEPTTASACSSALPVQARPGRFVRWSMPGRTAAATWSG